MYSAFLLINKYIFNCHLKVPGDLKGQKNRRIIPSVFQGADGLPGYLQGGCQLLLGNAPVLSYFFQTIFQGKVPPDFMFYTLCTKMCPGILATVSCAIRFYSCGQQAKRTCRYVCLTSADFYGKLTLHYQYIPYALKCQVNFPFCTNNHLFAAFTYILMNFYVII